MTRRQTTQTALPFNLDEVLTALREEPDGLSVRDLAEALDLDRAALKILTQILNQLQGAGLLRRHGQEYHLVQSQRVMIGHVRQRRRKTIHFLPEDPELRARGRIRVDAEDLQGAFDGDRVVASISHRNKEQERFARVEMIIQRGNLRIIGRLHHGFRGSWVESLDEKFPFDIDLEDRDRDETPEFADGWVVLVAVESYPTGHHPARGRILSGLGSSSSAPGMDIEIVIHKHDLPHIFPPEVLDESAKIPPIVTPEQLAGRLDLREQPTVTIDGETARDFDDAISLRKLDDGNFELSVHIADVSHYVRSGTPLDQEARLRGTSVYFPERAIPMLPESLSNVICSLNPQVDRLAMSAIMTVDGRGAVTSYKLRETVIRSDERMTYTDVNRLLRHSDPQLAQRYEGLTELFKVMEELAKILIRMREQRGAIDFNLPESVFEFDDEGRIAGVLKADRNIAHRIIEEFMLLANETVAGHMQKLGVHSIYRIHEKPEPQRVWEFAELAQAYGFKFPVADVGSRDYQRLSKDLEGKPEERVLAFAMLRSLQRARYSADNEGHFGLAAPVYTHFTSPIRRYPDLIVHRILRGLLHKSPDWGDSALAPAIKGSGKRAPGPIDRGELELMATESSERERGADAAEAEIDDWRKAVFMAGHLGEEFDGTITNVRDFGFFVELEDFFIEGLVSVRSLTDDFYQYDERGHSLIARGAKAAKGIRSGQNEKKRYRLGDRIRIRVDRVNVDRHLVDFSVVTKDGRGAKNGRQRKGQR
jgi:ribonuclease R